MFSFRKSNEESRDPTGHHSVLNCYDSLCLSPLAAQYSSLRIGRISNRGNFAPIRRSATAVWVFIPTGQRLSYLHQMMSKNSAREGLPAAVVLTSAQCMHMQESPYRDIEIPSAGSAVREGEGF
jgi:hypothetical protein